MFHLQEEQVNEPSQNILIVCNGNHVLDFTDKITKFFPYGALLSIQVTSIQSALQNIPQVQVQTARKRPADISENLHTTYKTKQRKLSNPPLSPASTASNSQQSLDMHVLHSPNTDGPHSYILAIKEDLNRIGKRLQNMDFMIKAITTPPNFKDCILKHFEKLETDLTTAIDKLNKLTNTNYDGDSPKHMIAICYEISMKVLDTTDVLSRVDTNKNFREEWSILKIFIRQKKELIDTLIVNELIKVSTN